MAEIPKKGVRKVVYLTEVDFNQKEKSDFFNNILFIHLADLAIADPNSESIEGGLQQPEYALKIYKSDQQSRFLLVHQETSAKNVVMLALQEFGITELSSNYSLCEVTVKVSLRIFKIFFNDNLYIYMYVLI